MKKTREQNPVPKLIDSSETAKLLKICSKGLWNITAPRGPLKCVLIGRCKRYNPDDVKAFIANQTQEME